LPKLDSRRLTLAALVLPLLLAGCSSLREPPPRDLPPRPQTTAPAPSAAASKTIDTERTPELTTAHASQKSMPQKAAANPVLGPQDYPDLFDRIRAGYRIPKVDDEAIDEQLAWYMRHQAYLDRTFTRGEKYLYHIVTELEARKMPLELALLPVVESAFEPFGFSRAKASGLWQFIAPTGKRYGLKQNYWYDGRRDVIESTRAALDYLEELHAEFGDWLLAVAAYNCGENNVRRAIAKNRAEHKPTDFWHLKLPRETRAYVPKLMAMSRLVENPAASGVELVTIPNVPFFGVVPTGGQLDLRVAADLAGITHEELTYLNPAFNRSSTDPSGPHQLLLPVDACEAFSTNLAQIPADERVRAAPYRVAKGDTLSKIARAHGTSPSAIMQHNGLSSTHLRVGQELLLPGGTGKLHPKVAQAAQRFDGGGSGSRSSRSSSGRYHTVRRNDTLWSIAQRYGLTVQKLASLNKIRTNAVLPVGRKLVVRGG
jgi:membrane-bound lytic murein transglycosylase D